MATSAAAAAFSILTRGPPLDAAARCVANATPARNVAAFDRAWHTLLRAYLQRTPSACRAITQLDSLGAHVHNDHIAMRSFVDSSGGSGLAFLGEAFTAFGYAPQDDIVIPSLPVNARWYEHPEETSWPKIFVSELRTKELPEHAAAIIFAHVDGHYGKAAHERLRGALSAGDGDALAGLGMMAIDRLHPSADAHAGVKWLLKGFIRGRPSPPHLRDMPRHCLGPRERRLITCAGPSPACASSMAARASFRPSGMRAPFASGWWRVDFRWRKRWGLSQRPSVKWRPTSRDTSPICQSTTTDPERCCHK
jgi:hypothetical protein